jgi:hypothetical protein
MFSPPLYRQRYQAALTYLAEEQQNVGTIQVTTPQSPFICAFSSVWSFLFTSF